MCQNKTSFPLTLLKPKSVLLPRCSVTLTWTTLNIPEGADGAGTAHISALPDRRLMQICTDELIEEKCQLCQVVITEIDYF